MTPARTRAAASGAPRSPALSQSEWTSSATPIARCPRSVPESSWTATRAVEPRPNQVFAGLSSVHGNRSLSTSTNPNPRPITASATSCTGSPPRTSDGQRTRISRSAPSYPSTVVVTSSRSTPCHSVSRWV